jgi:drug/metabolite transporter (DMT)-like permease
LLVVAAAALVLGERVGWRRWAAVLTGFAGVLIILRPGLAAFDTLSLLAVAGMIGFAGRDLATRAAPPSLSNRQLGVAGFTMLSLSGAIILGVTGGAVMPDARAAAEVAACAGFAVAAYAALTGAMRNGEVSVVTPFRYTRLVFAMILGTLVFAEQPDAATLFGSALIVGSGLYAMHRARRGRSQGGTEPE